MTQKRPKRYQKAALRKASLPETSTSSEESLPSVVQEDHEELVPQFLEDASPVSATPVLSDNDLSLDAPSGDDVSRDDQIPVSGVSQRTNSNHYNEDHDCINGDVNVDDTHDIGEDSNFSHERGLSDDNGSNIDAAEFMIDADVIEAEEEGDEDDPEEAEGGMEENEIENLEDEQAWDVPAVETINYLSNEETEPSSCSMDSYSDALLPEAASLTCNTRRQIEQHVNCFIQETEVDDPHTHWEAKPAYETADCQLSVSAPEQEGQQSPQTNITESPPFSAAMTSPLMYYDQCSNVSTQATVRRQYLTSTPTRVVNRDIPPPVIYRQVPEIIHTQVTVAGSPLKAFQKAEQSLGTRVSRYTQYGEPRTTVKYVAGYAECDSRGVYGSPSYFGVSTPTLVNSARNISVPPSYTSYYNSVPVATTTTYYQTPYTPERHLSATYRSAPSYPVYQPTSSPQPNTYQPTLYQTTSQEPASYPATSFQTTLQDLPCTRPSYFTASYAPVPYQQPAAYPLPSTAYHTTTYQPAVYTPSAAMQPPLQQTLVLDAARSPQHPTNLFGNVTMGTAGAVNSTWHKIIEKPSERRTSNDSKGGSLKSGLTVTKSRSHSRHRREQEDYGVSSIRPSARPRRLLFGVGPGGLL